MNLSRPMSRSVSTNGRATEDAKHWRNLKWWMRLLVPAVAQQKSWQGSGTGSGLRSIQPFCMKEITLNYVCMVDCRVDGDWELE